MLFEKIFLNVELLILLKIEKIYKKFIINLIKRKKELENLIKNIYYKSIKIIKCRILSMQA